MKNIFYSRIRFLSIFIILLALILIGKLIFIQILNGKSFNERAQRQYISPVSNTYDRGTIFFKQKDDTLLSAATLKKGFTIAINPRILSDPLIVFDKISPLLPELEFDSFIRKAGKSDDPYEEIAWKIDDRVANEIEKLRISGVNIFSEKWRFYPGSSLASHVLGFVGFKGEEFGGRYGIERYYEDILKRGKQELFINFFAEVFANIEQSLFYRNSREGDVVLSIEPEVQRILENKLEETVKKWNADSGGAIIIHPQTGSIYALSALPTFDPNYYNEEENYFVFSNPLVESVFEMGSIVKPLTIAIGLDTGAINPQSTYNDKGSLVLNGLRIGNYDGKARGVVKIQEILNQSLNTGAVHIMQEVGKEKFAMYLLALGLGEETGIDLPNEVPGLVDNLSSTREIEFATASYGQGIAMTPIAIVRALSSLANGGFLVTPHVAERIEYGLTTSNISYEDEKIRVFSEETVEDVTRMLVEVVDKALLGGTVKLDHYSVAAKTGTAQIALSESSGYYDDRFLHSFFGYFPAYDPQFFVFLYLVNPKEVKYASQTLTRPFIEMVKFLINYYKIPPDR